MDQKIPAHQLRIADRVIVAGHPYRVASVRLEHRDGRAVARLAYTHGGRHDQLPAAALITRISR